MKCVLYKPQQKSNKCVYMGQFPSWIGKWPGIGAEEERQSLPGGQVAQLWCQVSVQKDKCDVKLTFYRRQV